MPGSLMWKAVMIAVVAVALSATACRVPMINDDDSLRGEEFSATDDMEPRAASASEQPIDKAIQDERDQLLMLAAMSHAYAGLDSATGYDISAIISWNTEDIRAVPEFVIDRNRNFEVQGDIHHAEINTLRSAYEKRHDFDVPPGATGSERYARYSEDMKGTTLYTSLEPCPMCATTLTMAKVPRVVFCLEDPGLRDSRTHAPTIIVPTEFYGRIPGDKGS